MGSSRYFWWLKWPLTLAILAGLLAGAYWLHDLVKTERAAEASGEAIQAPRRVKNGTVTLNSEAVEDHGIQVETAQSLDWAEPVVVYGRLVPNPRAAGVVQAPFAGTLQADPKFPWPAVGARVHAGQLLGRIDLRVAPQDRLDLQLKWNEANLKVQGAEKVVAIQAERLGRLEKSSKGGEIVSQRELDDARVLLTEAQTNLAAAQAAEKLWQKAMADLERHNLAEGSIFSHSLIAPADGEVIESAAWPGTALEAGAVLLRLVDFRRPLAQVDFPAEILAAGPPSRTALTLLSASPGQVSMTSPELTVELIGPAPQVDPTSQLTGFWYEGVILAEPASALPTVWRPGRFVSARLRLPNTPPRPAVAIPATALLVLQGRQIVYVQEAPGKFERREVRLLGQEKDRAILATGVKPGEAVVVRQAQVLLSEEFRGEAEGD